MHVITLHLPSTSDSNLSLINKLQLTITYDNISLQYAVTPTSVLEMQGNSLHR